MMHLRLKRRDLLKSACIGAIAVTVPLPKASTTFHMRFPESSSDTRLILLEHGYSEEFCDKFLPEVLCSNNFTQNSCRRS